MYLCVVHCNDEVRGGISPVDYLVVLVLHEGTLMMVDRGEARSAQRVIDHAWYPPGGNILQSIALHPLQLVPSLYSSTTLADAKSSKPH